MVFSHLMMMQQRGKLETPFCNISAVTKRYHPADITALRKRIHQVLCLSLSEAHLSDIPHLMTGNTASVKMLQNTLNKKHFQLLSVSVRRLYVSLVVLAWHVTNKIRDAIIFYLHQRCTYCPFLRKGGFMQLLSGCGLKYLNWRRVSVVQTHERPHKV